MLRLHLHARDPLERFHEHFAAQLNDRHPSILTVARMGRFSSGRAIREYGRDIWHVSPASRDGEFLGTLP
jgi:glucan phosphorylase